MQRLEIREATIRDAAGIAKVHVDCWRSTYRGLMPDALLDRLEYGNREAMWTGILDESDRTLEFVWVAESEDKVVGFSSGGRERSGRPGRRGEIYAIYVLAESQRRGLGRALLEAIACDLYDHRFDSMMLW